MQVKSRGESGQRADRPSIRADHNISDLKSTGVSRPSRSYIVDNDPPISRESQTFCQARSNGLRASLDLDAMYVPILTQALVNEAHNSCRNGKAQPLAPTRFGENESINPYDVTFGIDQGAATITWVDRRIGLNVNQWTRRIGLPRN